MKIKPYYFLFPLAVILIAVIGSVFTSSGMDWYDATVTKPVITPPDWAFPIAWNIIFVCLAISSVLFYKKGREMTERKFIFFKKRKTDIFYSGIGLLIINFLLNVLWSFIFFYLQMPGLALIEIFILWLNIGFLIFIFGKASKVSAWLLTPYFLWVSLATYLNFSIWILN